MHGNGFLTISMSDLQNGYLCGCARDTDCPLYAVQAKSRRMLEARCLALLTTLNTLASSIYIKADGKVSGKCGQGEYKAGF